MAFVRSAFTGLTGAFLVLLPLQFLFAGVGVFGGSFDTHEAFGAGLLHLITILIMIFALIMKQWKLAGLAFALVLTIFLQISLVEIGRDADSPWISAIHPFLAFLYWPYVYFLIWLPWKSINTADQAPSEPSAA
ncbi:MAG: DUF6220 domain-containing protein [Solirubrobacterales bacterium]